jgi:aryl carrier-like protein
LIAAEPLLDQWTEAMRENAQVDHVCQCPIGVTYFSKFLQLEFNNENLQAYLDSIHFMKLIQNPNITFEETNVSIFCLNILERIKILQ